MKNKKSKIVLGSIGVVIIALFALTVAKGIIVFDHGAQRIGENDITWKGVNYYGQ